MPGILVVEDDENLNRGITFSLKKSGYEVFSAESVKKAKRIASDNNVKLVGVSQQHLKEIMYLKDEYKVSVKLFNQFTSDLNKWPYHFWNLDVADIEMYIR